MTGALQDWDYEQAHRKASEALLAATDSDAVPHEIPHLLHTAEECGLVALDHAESIRQIVLSVGLLQTVYAEKILHERGYSLDQLRQKR